MIKKINLTTLELEELLLAIKQEKNPKILRRLQIVHLCHLKVIGQEIASFLCISEASVSIWKNSFLAFGLEKLKQLNYDGRRPVKLDKIKNEIIKRIESHNVKTAKELQSWILKNFNLSQDISWIRKFLKKNAICLSKKAA